MVIRFNYLNAFGCLLGGLWTELGGRARIEGRQRRNLRRLVDAARRGSPLLRELLADAPPSDVVRLSDLPVTRKPELMHRFDEWLTTRSLTLDRARALMSDMRNLGVPVGDLVVLRTSESSGEPAVIACPSFVF